MDKNVNGPCDCTLESNIYFNGLNGPPGLKGEGDAVADPLYRNVDVSHPATVDLRVAKDSPALGSGNRIVPALPDFTGKTRPAGADSNRGAYEQ